MTVTLMFDDEEAGGHTSWSEETVTGAIPAAGDWVWAEMRKLDSAGRIGRYVVVRRSWTFVQPGSPNDQLGRNTPLVRIHVKKDTP